MTIHDALAESSVEHVDDRKGVTRHTWHAPAVLNHTVTK